MLLMYADGRVRLWDTQTTEFRRSTSIDKAEELLGQGGWTELYVASISSVIPADTFERTAQSHSLAICRVRYFPYFQVITKDWMPVSYTSSLSVAFNLLLGVIRINPTS